jgi:hypothetical protein
MVAGYAGGLIRGGGVGRSTRVVSFRQSREDHHRRGPFQESAEQPPPRFVVCGTLHGRKTTITVAGPAEVIAEIGRWAAEDPDATGVWGIPTDYSEPVTLLARGKPGQVRESARVAHALPLSPGVPLGMALTARCGERYAITELEWLPLGAGMPCENCLRLTPAEPDCPAVVTTPDHALTA